MSRLTPEQIVDAIVASESVLSPIRYADLASAFLILYEYIITFPSEVAEIWTSKFTGAKLLFLIHRYGLFPSVVAQLMSGPWNYHLPAKACFAFHYLNDIGIFVNYSGILIFTLRTYAIYQQLWVLVLLLVVGTSIPILQSFQASKTTLAKEFVIGTCFTHPKPITLPVSLAVNSLILAYDGLVFFLTVYKTFRLSRELSRLNVKGGLTACLLRDGIFYFFATIILRSLFMATDANPWPIPSIILQVVNACVGINPLLVNRLVLNLRQAAHQDVNRMNSFGKIDNESELPEPEYAYNSVVGNLGAPIRFFEDESAIDSESLEVSDLEGSESAPPSSTGRSNEV